MENESSAGESNRRGFSPDDEKLVAKKAESGALSANEGAISPTTIDFHHFDFPELANEKVGQEVVVVLRGFVERVNGPKSEKDGPGYPHLTTCVRFSKASVIHGNKSMKPGGGGRFQRLEDELEDKGVRDPGALAAKIGMKKYGKSKFQKWAASGRRRAA